MWCSTQSGLQTGEETVLVSSHITTALILVNCVVYSEGYRATVRATGLFPVLVASLTSPSLTVVSNATGTLACLAEGNMQDQAALLALGALPALQVLYSPHFTAKFI